MRNDDRLAGVRGSRAPSPVSSLRELPRAAQPTRDLWPAIVGRLAGKSNAGSAVARCAAMPVGAIEPAVRWWRTRVAAPLLVAALSVIVAGGWIIGHRSAPTGRNDGAAISSDTSAQYLKARPALMRALNTQLATLPPASRETVVADLQTIERSMRDLRAALGRDPGNALLRALLLDTYQDEEHLLFTVQEASNGTQQVDDPRRKS